MLSVLIRAIGPEPGRDRGGDVGSILDDFFAAGGRYKGSEFNIAELLFDIDPELLLSLERNRNALNGPSLAFLLERVDDVRRTVDALRVTAAQAYEREREVRILRHAEEQERQREHQEREAERAAHAATIQAARTAESLPAMTERLATLAILERMAAIASQIGYAPASFPGAWAAEITETHATELDESTLSVLVERTRGVQGG